MSSQRFRPYEVIFYGSQQELVAILRDNRQRIAHYVYILHDRDTYEEDSSGDGGEVVHRKGDLKKAHYHILVDFFNGHSFTAVKKMWTTQIDNPRVEVISSRQAKFEYLTHKGYPEKFQYLGCDLVSDDISYWNDLCIKTYKRNRLVVKIRNVFHKLFKQPLEEEPLFYSTIPVSFPHVRLTLDLIQRKTRFAYKSVVWVDEATLLADSQLYKDQALNAQLLEFCKLFGHETKGGCLFFTSHCLTELHIAMRRASSEYFYVHSLFKWIPFFMIATVREERYSEDGTAVNVYSEDVEDSLKTVIIPKSVWKKFDCYCYSILTDDLPVEKTVVKSDILKCDRVVSFSPYHRYEKKEVEEVEKVA